MVRQNIAYAFDSTYTSCIAFYVAQRLFGACWYIGVAIALPNIRGPMIATAALVVISCAVWIGTIHVAWPNQLAPIFIALTLDMFGGVLVVWLTRQSSQKTNAIGRAISHWFEFAPAVNIEHRVERNNAFISLVCLRPL